MPEPKHPPTEDLEEIDSGWEEVEPEPESEPAPAAPPRPPPRRAPSHTRVAPPHRPLLPTLPELDPLQHDPLAREPRTESRPTLPVIDPLKYDKPDDD